MVMKRIVIVLLAGALGLSATAALALRQSEAPQPAAARKVKPVVANVDAGKAQAPAAACDSAAMLVAIRDDVEIAPPLTWESVDIKQCQNGYARVLAHAGNVPPGTALDEEQVFLRDLDGSWEVITSGSGIACSDEDRSSELEEACEGLGLS
jgi:hypothetical protein